MATELASAYVTLIPSLKGAQSSIQKQLGAVDVSRAGQAMGTSLMGGFNSKLAGGMEAAGRMITKTLGGAITALGGSVVALAAKGGITRALNIEQAEYKLKALKLDVDEVMKSVSASVKGTKFGLDEAATVAASLASTGVAAGDGMTQTLQAVAGMATIAGTNLAGIGLVFGQVSAKGRVYAEELLQFSERGLNATGALADFLGVTTAEVQKLVSQGKVDFQTFADAMYAAFGDAAYGANDTFSGAMANVRAALSRVGEKFADPALDGLRKVFVAAIGAVDALASRLTPVAKEFAEIVERVSGRVTAFLGGFSEAMGNGVTITQSLKYGLMSAFGSETAGKIEAVASILGVVAALGPALIIAGKAMPIFSRVGGAVASVTTQLGAGAAKVGKFAGELSAAGFAASKKLGEGLGAGFTMGPLYAKLEEKSAAIKTKVAGTFDKVSATVKGNLDKMVLTGKEKLDKFVEPWEKNLKDAKECTEYILGGIVYDVKEKLSPIIAEAKKRMSNFKDVIKMSVGDAAKVFKQKMDKFRDGEKIGKRVFTSLRNAATKASRAFGKVSIGLGGVATGILAAGLAAVMGGVDIEAKMDDALTAITTFTANLPKVAGQFAELLPGFIASVVEVVPALTSAIGTALMSLLDALVLILPSLIQGVVGIITSIVPAIVGMAPTLLAAGFTLFSSLLAAFGGMLGRLVEELPSLVGRFRVFVSENLPTMLDTALELFLQIVEGLVSMIPILIENLPLIITTIVEAVIGFLPRLGEAAGKLFYTLISAIPAIADSLFAALGDLLKKLPSVVVSFAGQMAEAGLNMVKGIGQGITNAVGWIKEKIKELCNSALGALKKFFGIASPSKVMAKMGNYLMEGLGEGIDEESALAVGSMQNALDKVADVTSGFAPFASAEYSLAYKTPNTLGAAIEATTPSSQGEVLYSAFLAALMAVPDRAINVFVDGRKMASNLAGAMSVELARMELQGAR